MAHEWDSFVPTRRGILTLAAGGCVSGWRLYGFSSDFWNKKEPAEWSAEEIEQLTSKSPWSKEASAQFSRDEDGQGGGMGGPQSGGGTSWPGAGGGMGGPRIGGMGGGRGGMGGPGMGGGRGGGRGRGGQSQSFKGTVRWESAKPVLEALKTPLPDAFANHYVISASGFPMMSGHRRGSQDDDSQERSSQSNDDMLDHLKALTFLEPKGREGAQPGVVQQQPSSSGGNFLFGFSKEILVLKPEDKEVTFSTRLGRLTVKTKFNLKDMMYHGELAV